MRPVHLTRLPCLLQLVLLGIHGSAAAQATYNPTTAQFTASPDQNATLSDGRPVVQSYQLDLYYSGASAPFQSVNLGKPVPDATNTITVDLTAMFAGWPIPGTTYIAGVSAVGPGGASTSALSNTFAFSVGGTTSPDGTMVPPASRIVDNVGAIWTIGANQMILRNSVQVAGGWGSEILWKNTTIYVLGADNNWWQWTALGWINLGPTPPGGATSPDGTMAPPAPQIVDNVGAIWTIAANQAILRNGVQAAGGWGSKILWKNTTIYVLGTDNNWWRWTGTAWINMGPAQP